MTGFGPLDEGVVLAEGEYTGGPGLVQLGPSGASGVLLHSGQKLGILTRAGKQIVHTDGTLYDPTLLTDPVTGEVYREHTLVVIDQVDPVTGISVSEADQDGPVLPR